MWRMARIALLIGVGVVALAPATARESPLLPEAKEPSRLLGVVWHDPGGARLVSIDPRSLVPIPGRALSLIGAGAWAFSPDRQQLALAGSCQQGQGLSAGVVLVETARLRPTGCLWLGGVTAMIWPKPRRLVAVTDEVISIDPISRRILGRRPLPVGQQLLAMTRTAGRLVLLVGSAGQGRLIVVDDRGGVGTVELGVPAGMQPREATFVQPGLAVDAAGSRAFVVTEAGPVAEVSLKTLDVAYRDLHEVVSFLGRIGAWLQPAAQAKDFHPSALGSAHWLGNGLLAVAGMRSSQGTAAPTGLTLIDTRTWSRRMLDRGVSSATVSQGRLVAAGPGAGLSVYDVTGRLLYRRFAGRAAWVSLVHRGRVYLNVGSERRLRVLELVSGRQIGRHEEPPPRLLLGSSG
jgi:hypothetical protein